MATKYPIIFVHGILMKIPLFKAFVHLQKKLTEEQLHQLINPELSPQKMQELIELAELINQNQ